MTSPGIFSIRIVTVDYYMEKPKPGLDLCFSEFRAKEIKKVPVIRIFGSTAEGVKTCMHVHSIFPYLYIPFDRKTFDTLDKSGYLIASSLDRAINISLGQSNSGSQHVLKIQLVKGIPFYGYHPKEHQYLKIYMLNPRFVRRAANLLQNGAIMGKTFHTHESHVPYILQFFIDYNLYGMSFLHVPKEVLKFRRNDEQENIPYQIPKAQILDSSIAAKQSTSKLEVDISCCFILNRFQLENKTSTHANPGIESIWQDEKVRRQNLSKDLKTIPPLAIPPSQERPDVKPTNSEDFYRVALLSKLQQLENPADETMNETIETIKFVTTEKKKTFNLSKLLINAVYPEECTQDDLLTNASVIDNHFPSGSLLDSSNRFSKSPSTQESDNSFMDETIVDEDLIRCLSQPDYANKTLREEDMELLDVMQELEDRQDENDIDLDSTLAPLSQNIKFNNSQHAIHQKLSANDSSEDESDNECLNDFTMVMDDIDELLIQLSQPSLPDIAQVDRTDDLLRTPTKKLRSKLSNTPLHTTPKRSIKTDSPRTPKSTAKKYEPLPLLIKSRSVKKNLSSTTEPIEEEPHTHLIKSVKSNRKKQHVDLDKTHITCELRPYRNRNEAKLKTYYPQNLDFEPIENNSNQVDTNKPTNCNIKKDEEEFHLNLSNLNPVVNVKRLSMEKNPNNISRHQQNNTKKSVLTNDIGGPCMLNSLDNSHNQSVECSPVEISHSPVEVRKLRRLSSKHKVRILHENSSESPSSGDPLTLRTRSKSNVSVCPLNSLDKDEQFSTPLREKRNEFKDHNLDNKNIVTDTISEPRSISKRRKRLALKLKGELKKTTFYKREKESLKNSSISNTEDHGMSVDDSNKCPVKCKKPIQSITKELRVLLKRFPIESKTSTQTKRISTPTEKPKISRVLRNSEIKSSPRPSKACHDESFKDTENDNAMESFCEQSFVLDKTICSDLTDVQTLSNTEIVVIKPKIQAETYKEVKDNYALHNIPDMVHKTPFYSDYLDAPSKKEVGHTLLCIPVLSLNYLEDFESPIANLESFTKYRKKIVQTMDIQLRNETCIKEYFSKDEIITAIPTKLPPSKQDAKIWLKAKELLNKKNIDAEENIILENSPIEIHRQKVSILVNTENDGALEDADSSICSLSLTPLTPPIKTDQTHKLEDSSNKIVLTDIDDKGSEIKRSEDSDQKNTQFNRADSSQEAQAELEKLSFLNNLHNSQGSFDSSFGISHATLNNTFGFKVNLENLQQAKSDIEHNHLTTLSLEVFVSTREDLLPNPQFDAISCIFYAVENSIPTLENSEELSKTSGLILISDGNSSISSNLNYIGSDVKVKEVANEIEGLAQLIDVCSYWDPDIFVGYEIEMSSWGYVMERAKFLDFNIAPLLSRVPTQNVRDFVDEEREKLTDLDVETKLCGRILLDVWRLMRSEIALTSYTFENVMYHILHRRCPLHSCRDLTEWFRSPQTRWIVLEYFFERVRGTLELLDQLDLIGRTSEMAKLIGIQFYEVLSRGSQFRVESMMLRIAKPKNLVPLSPSVQQRAHMRAPEYLPLILEPQSRFYPDPIIVLDFQSLYPSMIMAYNYCFSTCLGRVENLGQSVPFEFGASQLRVSPKLLGQLLKRDMVTISPCGIVFIKKDIREGVLPRMLKEILDTRQMVKQSMKLHKNNTALQRILHSRQLGLKLIANVTYGYTAANFSGRMPCVEVGDSVVAKGRETLERAIKLVEANEEWNVKVVYGDTDSMFVLVPGRSKTEAFKIGSEIADLVTKNNPQPVKLKLEKVYQPCILQTKKRYVGYMYESPEQKEPIFEAKGIETVRRDGCPAAVKMLEKTLRILFETADVSQVKKYICRQFTKLLSGKANIQDLLFAKEFRGLKGYKPTACVPALELTRKWMQLDPRKIPRSGERVQFIVTNGPPGVPLIKLVRSPHDVLADEGLKVNAIYYITKAIIPPLNRCLLLIGADVNEWFASLPRKILFSTAIASANEVVSSSNNGIKKSTISQYFSSTKCIVDCGRQTKETICSFCSTDVTNSLVTLEDKISKLERAFFLTQFICQSCCGRPYSITCTSFDCPVLYVLEMRKRELSNIHQMRNIINDWL
ncbi:DNA polymerase zeta catalytic subunit isoform X2 [Eupeodes corollae]|uniref:DNA polymerase zeta catalytic subunit isoform X2 n=1 Tax=Eupeodes corollae TaxID=290404 RepID=UPI002493087A|nr:DNA polymerase zeta catalytic subunit isoform X2 [Eupeodes corollae]